MSREPEPTLEDEWSAWETYPQRQSYWPGLGLEHREGYEVNHGRLEAIGERLIATFDEVYRTLYQPMNTDRAIGTMDWYAAYTTYSMILRFEEKASCLCGDVMAECAAAGATVATTGRNYRFAEHGGWRAKPALWEALDSGELADDSGSYRVSEAYPKGDFKIAYLYEVDSPVAIVANDNSCEGKGRAEIREMLMSWKPEHLTALADMSTRIANGLTEVSHELLYRAQEIRDAPWHGPVADTAQGSLRGIYENVRGLAAVHGRVALRTTECAQVLSTAQQRFDQVVNKGGWEFSDLWHGDDDDARGFMSDVNRQWADVLRRLPEAATIALPGLIPESDRDVYSLYNW